MWHGIRVVRQNEICTAEPLCPSECCALDIECAIEELRGYKIPAVAYGS